MKRFLPLVVLLAIVGATVGSGKFLPLINDKLAGWFAAEDAIPVTAVQVRRSSLTLEVHGIGELRPVKEVDIVSSMAGLLEEVRYKVGDAVAAGQVVASVRATELIQQLREAEAAIKAAQADLREKQTRLGDLENGLERTRELRNKDLIAGQDLSAAEAAVATARAQKELAEAQVAQQQASLERLRYLLGFSKVLAPFGGVVTRRVSEPGTYLQRSEPIVTLANPDVLQVMVKVPEEDLSLIHGGMPAQIKVEAHPGRTFEGTVVELHSGSQTTGSNSAAEIHMTNSERLLKIGMRASVSLLTGEERAVLLIPKEAIREATGNNYVDIVMNGRVQQRAITVGRNHQSMVEVISGVREGEWVIINNRQQPLAANRRVSIVAGKTGPNR